MRSKRFIFSLLIIAIIIAGLLSRYFKFIPLFVGDILWAALVYFLFRFVFAMSPVRQIALFSLLFSFAIEFFQLYSTPELVRLRQTLFGRLVLGATFNPGDLLCYTIGIFIAAVIDSRLLRSSKRD